MPYRFTPLINGNYYHIFNRGVNKRKIFLDPNDYQHALDTLHFYLYTNHKIRFSFYNRLKITNRKDYFNTVILACDLVAYVFMPNHFHLLINQNEKDGISNTLRLFENSYTKYFNTKYKRIGPLLQGPFKAVLIENDNQLLHVSRYIHLNPYSAGIVTSLKELEKYQWSSYPSYLETDKEDSILRKQFILEQFGNQSYKTFIAERASYQRELEEIKHIILE